MAGIPVAALGLLMYLGLIGLLAARRIGPARLRGEPGPLGPWVFALAASGALYSLYLTYLEFFVIEAVCAWCLASAGVVTAIAVLAAPDLRAQGGAAASGLGGRPSVSSRRGEPRAQAGRGGEPLE